MHLLAVYLADDVGTVLTIDVSVGKCALFDGDCLFAFVAVLVAQHGYRQFVVGQVASKRVDNIHTLAVYFVNDVAAI